MKPLDHTRPDLAFVPRDVPMFGALIARIDEADDLPTTRRRDLISGLRRVAKALGRAPEEVPADPKWLQPRLAKVMPAGLGLSPKAWQNAQSDARSAMAWAGIVKRRHRHIDDLSPAWRDLWAQVLASKDPTLPLALCRFVHFLSGLGVTPDEVSQAQADAYLAALEADEISKSPQRAWRAAVNAWNLATTRIDAWPQTRLVLPRRQTIITWPDTHLPAGFMRDLANLTHRLEHPDPFAEDGPARALRPESIRHYTRLLKRFASELLEAGVPPSEIDCVAALCDPGLAERGLRAMVARRGGQTGALIAETASLLASLATKLGLGDDVSMRLGRLAERVAVPARRGMTRKNRARLRPLQDDRTLRRLLELPERLFAAQGRKRTPHAAALAREDALAIALLIACPVRIKNLAGIHLERHLHRPGDGRVFLVLIEDDIKNGQPMEFELPADVRRMLDKHLASRVPMLCPPGTPWLFPKRCGTAPIDGNPLSARLAKRIRTEVGIEMNAHLFRHLAAMVWLDANPGGYEAARQLLGHAASSHTIRFYSGLEARSAMQAYGDVLARKRGRGR